MKKRAHFRARFFMVKRKEVITS